MITTFLLLFQKNKVFCGSKGAKHPVFFGSLPAYEGGKKGEAELDTKDTFDG
jgi:hypothetical protein